VCPVCELAFTGTLVGAQDDEAVAEATAALAVATLASNPDNDVSGPDAVGVYHNHRLDAPNVWRTDVHASLVAEAADIFERCDLRAVHARLDVEKKNSRESVSCDSGSFFAHHAGWNSDVSWISCDDQQTHDQFQSLFQRLGLPRKFANVVHGRDRLHETGKKSGERGCEDGGQRRAGEEGDGGPAEGVHLYSAFFVVRSWCSKPDMHVDYSKAVGTHALTLMTPLYSAQDSAQEETVGAGKEGHKGAGSFHLLYQDTQGKTCRYRYHHGEAIVFGARFVHSTEPGRAAAGTSAATCTETVPSPPRSDPQNNVALRTTAPNAHVYLCFTFGSDQLEHWPAIAQTVDGKQSRQICPPGQPAGQLRLQLSKLGKAMEAGTADEVNALKPYGGSSSSVPPSPSRIAEPAHAHAAVRVKRDVYRRRPRGILK